MAEAKPEEASGLRIGLGLQAELVPGYLDETIKHRQFTDLARLVLGHVADREQCVKFYQQVALVNLPRFVQPTSGTAQAARWDDVALDLDAAWERLVPQAMLGLGQRMGAELANWHAARDGTSELSLCLSTHPAAPDFSFRAEWAKTHVLREPAA